MFSTNEQLLLNALAGGMLVFAFFIVARMRLRTMVTMFALQSILLAIFAAVVAQAHLELQLLITAVLTLGLKAWFIPRLLVRTAERADADHRLPAFLRPATALFAGFVMVAVAFLLTRSIIPVADANYLIVGVSVSLILLGLQMLVSCKGMYGQIIGFLLMENGIFVFGLTLTGGMPLLVDLGVFFDVTIGSVLMAGLSYRVQREHATMATDTLSELTD